MATYALSGYGALVSAASGGDYASAADGTGDIFLLAIDTSTDGLPVGQISSFGGTRIAYQSFLEFDTSDLIATPSTVELSLAVLNQVADPIDSDQFFSTNVLISVYDWGGAPIDTSFWVAGAALNLLTPIASQTTVGHEFQSVITFSIPGGAINIAGLTRFAVYTEAQWTGTETPFGGVSSDSDGFQEITFISPDEGDSPTPLLSVNAVGPGGPPCTNPQFIVSTQLRAYLKLTP